MSRLTSFSLRAGFGAALLAVAIGGVLPVRAALMARSAPAPSLPGLQIGTWHSLAQHAWLAYYDSHKDSYVNTDVSSKQQATSLGINYSPILAHALGASSPMYFVKGRAAAGQIAVFGSEPGEKDYSPLWREIWVTWKAGTTPVLLTSDNQVLALVKSGKLTEQMTSIVLNAPVTSVRH